MPIPIGLDKINGSLFGGAIGDAMGGPIEPWVADLDFLERKFGTRRIETLYDYLDEGPDWYFKGSPRGAYTDDTLVKNAVCKAIIEARGRIGAREFAKAYGQEMRPEYFTRKAGQLWPGEAVIWFKLYFNITGEPYEEMPDARDMGQGNIPAGDAGMIISPVGLINAGDPYQAAMDAVEVSSVLQSGLSATAPSAIAAAVATAMIPGVTIDEVLEAGARHTDRRTSARIRKAVEMARTATSAEAFREEFHKTMLPGLCDALEMISTPFGILALTKGDYRQTIIEAVNFQGDVDTIAGMAGSIAGALHGLSRLPQDWVETVRSANADQPSLDSLGEGIFEALKEERRKKGEQIRLIERLTTSEIEGAGARKATPEL